MSIKVKSGGLYAGIQGLFEKKGGVYGAASVFAKVAGAYQAVGQPVEGAPLAVGTLPDLLFNQSSGSQIVQTAQGFIGSGLIYSVQSFPSGAQLSINSSTGQLTIGTANVVNSTADGNVVIRATNAFGFAQQSFPLFVVAEQTFTILAREENGTVTVESLASTWTVAISERLPDGSFNVTEVA
jgi:hypothetical protein